MASVQVAPFVVEAMIVEKLNVRNIQANAKLFELLLKVEKNMTYANGTCSISPELSKRSMGTF